jgi:hypothetical protein
MKSYYLSKQTQKGSGGLCQINPIHKMQLHVWPTIRPTYISNQRTKKINFLKNLINSNLVTQKILVFF